MSEIKLLPCPHCEDGKAVLHTNELTDKYHVTCCDCGCRTADFKHPEEAIGSWNTRKPMERIIERLEVKKRRDGTESDREWGKYIGYVDSIKIVKEEGRIE